MRGTRSCILTVTDMTLHVPGTEMVGLSLKTFQHTVSTFFPTMM